MIRVKIEGGLELTFHITEKTEITEGMLSGPSLALKPGDFVVAGSNPGSKYDKAEELGVKIVNEKEFLKML